MGIRELVEEREAFNVVSLGEFFQVVVQGFWIAGDVNDVVVALGLFD